MRRDASLLNAKAIASLRQMVETFNGLNDDGRQGAVLRDLQHTFEMLLKAGLCEKKVRVFDKKSGRAISFEKCLRLAREHLGLNEEQVGLLRAIDALRDDEQHWLAEVNEGLLYLQRAQPSRSSTRFSRRSSERGSPHTCQSASYPFRRSLSPMSTSWSTSSTRR